MTRLIAAAAILAAAHVSAQPVPLPNTYDGFKIGDDSAPVMLEGFLDLLCPDCAGAYPTLKQVAAHYGPSKLKFILHIFPLPYHTWAFAAANGAQVIKSINGSDAAVFAWADAMFIAGEQANFWVGQGSLYGNGNQSAVTAAYAAVAEKYVPGITAAAFLAGMNDDDLNEDARIAWKYACSRYTTGTPNFLVNGLPVAADPSWTLAQWQQLLDPLYSASAAKAARRAAVKASGVC